MSLPIRGTQSHLIHTPTTILNYASSPSSQPHKTKNHKLPKTLISTKNIPKTIILFHLSNTPHYQKPNPMAAMNSNVLACSYAISGVTGASELSSKVTSLPNFGSSSQRMPMIKAQLQVTEEGNKGSQGRRAALLGLAAILAATASSSSANAGVIEDYLEKSKANKELNDKKRLATSGANFARAFTVQFGTCKFPENFTGCQDLAKQKKVPFLSEDLQLECEGKDKYKCGSNVFWKW